jgi:ABC-type phosphate transport system substrate-binding protein
MKTAGFAYRGHQTYLGAARDISSPVGDAIHHPKLIPAIVAAVIAVTVAWIGVSLSRWRRITWRDHMDTPINLMPKAAQWGATWAAWKVFANHQEVEHPSLVLLRVRNSGFTGVSQADMRRPMTFTFPGREVKEYSVTDCRGVTREMIQPPGQSAASVIGNRIALPRFPMKRRASFKLLVLLSGTDRGVLGKGRIRRGRVVHESRGRGPVARNIMFGTVLTLLVGAQAGVSFSQGASMPSTCGTGRLTLEGSTAFAPIAQQIGQAYTSLCRGAAISVNAISTFNGLNALNSAGSAARASSAKRQAATAQVAMSDGPAPGGYPALVGHPVGVIIFGVMVNKQAGVFNLTVAELRGMFLGTITNWRQVNGANLPIRIVARTPGSGTRRAFDDKVLGGHDEPPFSSYNCVSKNAVPDSRVTKCEVADTATLLQRVNEIPGAIGYAQISDAATFANVERVKLNGWDPDIGAVERGAYPYWTVEYIYTYGTPASDTLAAAFLNYVNSDTAKDILRSAAYTPCIDRQQSLTSTLCRGG